MFTKLTLKDGVTMAMDLQKVALVRHVNDRRPGDVALTTPEDTAYYPISYEKIRAEFEAKGISMLEVEIEDGSLWLVAVDHVLFVATRPDRASGPNMSIVQTDIKEAHVVLRNDLDEVLTAIELARGSGKIHTLLAPKVVKAHGRLVV